MIAIDETLCTSCGQCAWDCFPKALLMESGVPVFDKTRCNGCGHCVAICPSGAAAMPGLPALDFSGAPPRLDPKELLKALQARRSIRHFRSDPVPREKIEMIIEAGRYTPTGGNRQDVAYSVVTGENVAKLRRMALESLNDFSFNKARKVKPPGTQWYEARWRQMYEDDVAEKADELFFYAPLVVVVSSPSVLHGGLAASNMELMVYAQSLGMLYSGFFATAAADNCTIRSFLNLKDTYEVVTALVIGTPDVAFHRTAPKAHPFVAWL